MTTMLATQEGHLPVSVACRLLSNNPVQGELKKRVERPGCHRGWKSEEDEYIHRARAQGVEYSQMINDMFPGMNYNTLRSHARNIEATWSRNEDQKLEEMVGDGIGVDWDSIAAEIKPRSNGRTLKTRWEYLRMREQAWRNRR